MYRWKDVASVDRVLFHLGHAHTVTEEVNSLVQPIDLDEVVIEHCLWRSELRHLAPYEPITNT